MNDKKVVRIISIFVITESWGWSFSIIIIVWTCLGWDEETDTVSIGNEVVGFSL